MPVARLSSVRLLFDRGTMLLRDVDPGLDPSASRGLLWDPRVQAYRTPASRSRPLRRDLARRAAPFSDEVRVPQLPLGSWSPIELRPYQEAALWAWELAQRRAVVVLPTGSGKTRLALAAMARAGSSALCLVPTRILLAQWLHHIKRTYAGPVGCYGDGTHEFAALTVATFESAYRHMDRLGNRFDLLVVDEAHHFGCGLRDEALEMSIAAARLGLTATPPRDAAVAAPPRGAPPAAQARVPRRAARPSARGARARLHGGQRERVRRGPRAPGHARHLRYRPSGARGGAGAVPGGNDPGSRVGEGAERGD